MGTRLLVQQLGHLFGDRKQYFHPRFFAALIHSYSCHSSQPRTSNSLKTSLNSIYVVYSHSQGNISNTNTTVSFSLYPDSDAERSDARQFYVSGLNSKKNIFHPQIKCQVKDKSPFSPSPISFAGLAKARASDGYSASRSFPFGKRSG